MRTPTITTDVKRASLNDVGHKVLITAGRHKDEIGTMVGIGGGGGNGRWTQLVRSPNNFTIWSVRSAYRIREIAGLPM